MNAREMKEKAEKEETQKREVHRLESGQRKYRGKQKTPVAWTVVTLNKEKRW